MAAIATLRGDEDAVQNRLEEANRLELTKEAEMVNRMLKRNMTLKSIAEIMGVSPKSASNIKRKYDLPRGEDNG